MFFSLSLSYYYSLALYIPDTFFFLPSPSNTYTFYFSLLPINTRTHTYILSLSFRYTHPLSRCLSHALFFSLCQAHSFSLTHLCFLLYNQHSHTYIYTTFSFSLPPPDTHITFSSSLLIIPCLLQKILPSNT